MNELNLELEIAKAAEYGLQDFAALIAQTRLKLIRSDSSIRLTQAAVDNAIASHKAQIAFDETLKNESQRKAKELVLIQTDENLLNLQHHLDDLKRQREELAVMLGLYRDLAEALKLSYQRKISENGLFV